MTKFAGLMFRLSQARVYWNGDMMNEIKPRQHFSDVNGFQALKSAVEARVGAEMVE
jgi:hypothetical protein